MNKKENFWLKDYAPFAVKNEVNLISSLLLVNDCYNQKQLDLIIKTIFTEPSIKLYEQLICKTSFAKFKKNLLSVLLRQMKDKNYE